MEIPEYDRDPEVRTEECLAAYEAERIAAQTHDLVGLVGRSLRKRDRWLAMQRLMAPSGRAR